MGPSIRDGDWLLVDPDAYSRARPAPGDLVVARAPVGLVVKRVGGIRADEALQLVGDAPSGRGHGHELTVERASVVGRPWFRYWPPHRIGLLR